jgi:hypothetical protein
MTDQPSLFDPPKPEKNREEAVERLRRAVKNLLYIARRAQAMPWNPVRERHIIKDFELYSSELPPAERDELRAEFAKELERCRKASGRAA